jgi:hypothetical protein
MIFNKAPRAERAANSAPDQTTPAKPDYSANCAKP